MTVAVAASSVVALLTGCSVIFPSRMATDPPPGATGPSAGCGTTKRGGVADAAESIVVGGEARRYSLTVPSSHLPGSTNPIPLVLDFHGLLEGLAGTHPFATQFSALAEAEGFAVAYPIGGGDGVYWDVSTSEDNADLRYIDAVVAELEAELCIDRSRIYVTGLSFGAAVTSMLMCMRANTFAAAAPVAGIQDRCTATERRMPFVTFHGTADPLLPHEMYAAVPGAIAATYGCSGPPVDATLQPAPDPGTGGPIVKQTWDCAAVGSAIESYVIGGGGHSWPGSVFFSWIGFIVGPTTTSLDATAVIWEFFSRHHL